MQDHPFKKFSEKKKNSVVKEGIRQEKKKARKEKNAYFDNLKEEKYQARIAKKTGAAAAPTPPTTPNTKHTRKAKAVAEATSAVQEVMPLNKYLAHCGVASRRETVDIIGNGLVKVNGTVETTPGYKVQPTDEVIYNGKKCFVSKNLQYILLNKPKDFITTTDDPLGRKTVLQLIQKATTERVYPIGRLDRNTSGVLLLTNDGDLTQQLSHPSFEIKKIYEVRLDKNLTKEHFEDIWKGIVLEDGVIMVDGLAYADAKDKSIIGIEIHSGRNRVVRRIFESLGYVVKGLDRVMYAGLTKKNVERGKWRHLAEKEIRVLKYMNSSKGKKQKISQKEVDAALSAKDSLPGEIENNPTAKDAKPTLGKKEKIDAAPKKARKFKTHSEKKAYQKKLTGGK
jgi:23S rRNA pseudouridine2605 synthase